MNLTTGQRISTRVEDFLITNIITNPDCTHMLQTEGISELVNGKQFTFDTKIDDDITSIYSVNTVFIADRDNGYRKTKLYSDTHSKGLTGVGLDRAEWNTIKDYKEGEAYKQTIEKSELYKGKVVTYYAPFDKCDRVEDYKVAWEYFEGVFKER